MKNLVPALLLFALGPYSLQAASILSYRFMVDTHTLNLQAGNLDFQLNPGGATSPLVTAQISSFTMSGGTFTPASIQLTGSASGLLPATLTLSNTAGYNDAFQPVSLGSSISFLVTLSGPGVGVPGNPGTFFGFSIYDSAGIAPELTTAADGTIGGFLIDSVNGIAPFTNPASVNGSSVAAIAPVPEPSSTGSFGIGLGISLLVLRRR